MNDDEERLRRAVSHMGEPSWHILRALHPLDPLPNYKILHRVHELVGQANYPFSLDPSTLHHALKRMIRDGLVASDGEQLVDVPGPRGTTRRETRQVYRITGLGAQALDRHWHLEQLAHQERQKAKLRPAFARESGP